MKQMLDQRINASMSADACVFYLRDAETDIIDLLNNALFEAGLGVLIKGRV